MTGEFDKNGKKEFFGSHNEYGKNADKYAVYDAMTDIDLSGVDVGKECYITVDAKVGSFYGVSKTYKEAVTIGFAGGNGTAEDPYEISSLAHLNNVKSVLGKSYILKANIATNEPVVSVPDEFSGNFDGNSTCCIHRYDGYDICS